MWNDAWGPRMEHILRNALLVLLDQEDVTLPDILRLFHDDAFRKRAGTECTNLQVKAFWLTAKTAASRARDNQPADLCARAADPARVWTNGVDGGTLRNHDVRDRIARHGADGVAPSWTRGGRWDPLLAG
jgi:hypothetical protein